ncbi:MAG: ParB/RepB/Spo0J family partition protein [Eubacteriales bacterium]
MQPKTKKVISKPKVSTSLFGDTHGEQVVQLKLYELSSFKDHPFKVLEDESLTELLESIKQHGVTTPIIVRSKGQGAFEIISGHRRVKACELLELPTIPAFIRNLDDDEAVFQMVDTNIQREMLLPSEKAFAYKMKLEAIKRKAGRPENNGGLLVHHSKTRDDLAENTEDSGRQIQRFIRLTELIPDFLDLVDLKKLPFQTAVELSYLSHEEQENVNQTMVQRALTPSLEQATFMKKCSNDGNLSLTVIESILIPLEVKAKKVSFKIDRNKYFSKETPKAEIEELIIKLLDQWQATKNEN